MAGSTAQVARPVRAGAALLDRIRPDGSDLVDRGFDLPPAEASWGAYAHLTDCWRRQLTRRRDGGGR